eukprot:3490924-Amphidinium_carterae.1
MAIGTVVVRSASQLFRTHVETWNAFVECLRQTTFEAGDGFRVEVVYGPYCFLSCFTNHLDQYLQQLTE